MSQIREATIRDQLAQDLSVIEEGLELVDTERYIPNPSGTRGFIDLLARDSRGRHVLIELKRSDAAARQALHETFKYIDGIKANLAARDDELRVLIVSTEWTELLVPFSVAVTQVKFDVEGYLLHVNEFGKPLSAQRVSPVPVQEDRLFSPWHEVALYTSELNMNRGVASYEASCSRKGVEHYVLVLLKAGEDRRRRELDSLFVRLNSIRPPDQQLTREEIAQKVPEHSWMIYFGPLQIRDEDLIRGIRDLTPPDELEDFEQTISEMSGDELSCTLQEHLLALDPVPDRDYIEIGYPAKLTRFLNDDGWRVIRICDTATSGQMRFSPTRRS